MTEPILTEKRSGGLAALLLAALLAVVAVSAAVAPDGAWFLAALLAMVALSVAFFNALFPGSWFFSLALANGLGVYACIFAFFVDANFAAVDHRLLFLGFPLPILAFMGSAWSERRRIREIIVTATLPGARQLRRAFAWLGPVMLIGAVSFAMPALPDRASLGLFFLAAMSAIAFIVWRAGPHVSSFLIDTGLLFEEFLERVGKLAAAAFAFLTFYSFFVILFAGLYFGLEALQPQTHFLMHGKIADMTFPECLYFSVATLATVGYGDITPASDAARLLSAAQVIVGVLLLLFGFSEIMSYTRERLRGRSDG